MMSLRAPQVSSAPEQARLGVRGRSEGAEPGSRPARRPRTLFLDWADLEATASASTAARISSRPDASTSSARVRQIISVDSEVQGLRRNVRDSARAVLRWVAAVVDHEGERDLDAVLDRCLRPGPDVQAVNYSALAREIRESTGVILTAKAVRTAIAHLRRKRSQTTSDSLRGQPLKERLDLLRARLSANHQALGGARGFIGADSRADTQRDDLLRSVAVDRLAAVRSAASRLIENDYGEHISRDVDVDHLEARFLDFVRDVLRGRGPGNDPAARDLHGLLVSLCDYDGSTECDMRIVVDGARVVALVCGPDSLAGLLAQLNVLVAGRHLLDSELYVAELHRVADAAAGLHDDPGTKTFLNWARRQPEDRRLPSPLRVSSYCLNNAATHLLERIFKGTSPDPRAALRAAQHDLERMRAADSGFGLIQTTEVISLAAVARLTGDPSDIEAHFKRLGGQRTQRVLEDLARYDNCAQLVDAVRARAVGVFPALAHQVIRMR